MKKFIALGSILCCLASYSISAYSNNDKTTFLGPTLRGSYTSLLNDCTAYSVLGEAGAKNWRLGGTLAWKLRENQRLKLSAEYLWQNINYSFFSGDTNEWVRQGAIGVLYEYNMWGCACNPSFDLEAYLSHAPSKTLGGKRVTLINATGLPASLINERRIAGSNAAGVAPGVTIQPWCGSKVGVDLNYDNVRYDTRYGLNEDARGFGGTIHLTQEVAKNFDLTLLAAFRQPFNNYQAILNWVNVPYYGRWTLDLDAAYTAGKNTLPSTWNIGLSANYFLDQRCEVFAHRDFKDEIVVTVPDDFLDWTADPAVYIPQVLAIANEALPCTNAIIIVGSINDITLRGGATVTVPAAAAFSPSSGSHFSISLSEVLLAGNSITINPTTGVITIHQGAGTNQTVIVTVTAANGCGSASTSFTVTLVE